MYQKRSRDVYAIPGNHDWYDGLTAFLRLFCHTRWIGCWQTRQTRSYFAIRLPHGWWLWGLDMALEDDLDGPQSAYFTYYAKLLAKDDKVILLFGAYLLASNIFLGIHEQEGFTCQTIHLTKKA
jgi:hypothetical protein